MKNYDSFPSQTISWNEFEVITGNRPRNNRFENNIAGNKESNFSVPDRQVKITGELNTEMILYYTYHEDDIACMEEFRVKRNNDRFGFSAENPSDQFHREHVSH
jgi:hypothetical protein